MTELRNQSESLFTHSYDDADIDTTKLNVQS